MSSSGINDNSLLNTLELCVGPLQIVEIWCALPHPGPDPDEAVSTFNAVMMSIIP